MGIAVLINFYRGSFVKILEEEQRVLREKRLLNINESFHNIKSVKLFGWESKFLR